MAFALLPDEPLRRGIPRCLREQIDAAMSQLATREADPIEAIHQTRKALKRIRTLLYLIRDAIGEERFAVEELAFATLSRRLSSLRDAQMLLGALGRLATGLAGSPFAEAVHPVEQALAARLTPPAVDDELLRGLIAGLAAGRSRLEEWAPLLSSKRLRRSLRRGLRQLHRRSRRAYQLAYAVSTERHFHKWRQRLKELFYAGTLLLPTQPGRRRPSKLVGRLDATAAALGEEHDLAMLATTLHEDPLGQGGAVAVALLLQLIGRRRSELRQELRPLGRRLYLRPSRAFARRLGG